MDSGSDSDFDSMDIEPIESEARARNYVVWFRAKKRNPDCNVPSYSLFTDDDIWKEKDEQRLKWWKDFEKDDLNQYKNRELEMDNIIQKWKQILS
jgi:hypothetical protein